MHPYESIPPKRKKLRKKKKKVPTTPRLMFKVEASTSRIFGKPFSADLSLRISMSNTDTTQREKLRLSQTLS